MREKWIVFSFLLLWFLFTFGCQQSQETGPSPSMTPTPSPSPEIVLPAISPLIPVTPCQGCDPGWYSYRCMAGGLDITYRVDDSATCQMYFGVPRTTYTYRVRVTGSGPEPAYFEVVLPACVTESDILSADPSYEYFGPDLPCVLSGKNVLAWRWYPQYGGDKTFVLTVRGRGNRLGALYLRLEDPLPSGCGGSNCVGFGGCAPSCE